MSAPIGGDVSLGSNVVRALAGAKTARDAGIAVLREAGAGLGFAVGVLWLLDERTGLLRWAGDWAAGDTAEDLRRVSHRLTFAPGVGLPGRTFDALQPQWVADIAADADLPRAEVALDAGLRAVVDVPVTGRAGPLGVLELFGERPQEPAPEQVEALRVVGQQLGEYLSRMRVEERLRLSEESSASIVRAALDCIVTMDHRGRVIDFNPAAEETFGYERDAVVGELLADLIIPPELRAAHQRSLSAYVEHGRPTILNRRLELEGMRSDGTTFPVELTVTRLGTEQPPVFAGFLRDITSRRDADAHHARLLEREQEERARAEEAERAARRVAEALQSSLLPPHLPAIPGVELGAAYRAAGEGWQVGGDFYDVFELEAGRWALVIGDVCGKGPEAAAMTAMIRYATRAAAVRDARPDAVLRAVNDAVLAEPEQAAGIFTAVYASLDVGGARPVVRLAAAGHPLPLLLDAGGGVRAVGHAGTLLGAFADISTRELELELGAGEVLLFYTDGVIEARTSEGFFGDARLAELLAECRGRGPQDVASHVLSAVNAAANREARDDLALLALRAG